MFVGTQNIFLCFIFVILIFTLRGLGAQNIQTSNQGDLRKTRHVKGHIYSADIRQIVVKIKQKMFDAILT